MSTHTVKGHTQSKVPASHRKPGSGQIVQIGGLKLGDYATKAAFLRGLYNRGAQSILDSANAMVAAGRPVQEAAEFVVHSRNQLKISVRAQGPWLFRRLNEIRNKRKYGNTIGPTYKQQKARLLARGIPSESVDEVIIGRVAKTSQGFNAARGYLRVASIAGEVVGFALMATQSSPEGLEPLPKTRAEELEAEQARIRYGIPASANIDRHGHLKTNSYLQVDIFDPHVGSEFEQETEEILWWLGLAITYHYDGVTWTVPGHSHAHK